MRGGTRFNRTKNHVVDCYGVRALRKEMKDPSLFVYYHTAVGTYTLASWIQQGSIMYELMVLGKQPRITRAHKDKLHLMVTGNPRGRANVKATRARMNGEKNARDELAHQTNEELIDAQAALRDALGKRNPNARDDPYFAAANRRDNNCIKVSMHM